MLRYRLYSDNAKMLRLNFLDNYKEVKLKIWATIKDTAYIGLFGFADYLLLI